MLAKLGELREAEQTLEVKDGQLRQLVAELQGISRVAQRCALLGAFTFICFRCTAYFSSVSPNNVSFCIHT